MSGISADRGFTTLKRDVIDRGLCTRCGGCFASCPVDAISFTPHGMELTGDCIACGNCTSVCPGAFMDFSLHEMRLFGKSRRRTLGTHHGIYKSKKDLSAGDSDIYRRGYFGGRVTAILIHALERGMIDAALLTDWSGSGDLSIGRGVIARTKDDVIRCASSKYVFSPVLGLLKEVRDDDHLQNVAIVCLPCHVHALRNMELYNGTEPLTRKVRYIIGLNCGAANLDENGWREVVEDLTGVRNDRIASFRANKTSGNMIRFTIGSKNGNVTEKDLSLNRYLSCISSIGVWDRCMLCPDYSSELSDITFGMPYIRTDKGEDLVRSAEICGVLVKSSLKRRFYQKIVDLVMPARKIGMTKRNIRIKKRKGDPYPVYR